MIHIQRRINTYMDIYFNTKNKNTYAKKNYLQGSHTMKINFSKRFLHFKSFSFNDLPVKYCFQRIHNIIELIGIEIIFYLR